jgi:hypothetical protein
MRSSIGTALLSNIIIVFLVVMITFLIGSLSYTKAYRIKNNVLNLIEREKGFDAGKIDAMLAEIGYRIVDNTGVTCTDRRGGNMPYPDGYLISGDTMGKYRYCVYRYHIGDENGKKMYVYAVTTYMYFDIPLIGSMLEFPIYGETKTIYE